MSYLIEQANLSKHIICDSAGTGDYHIGKPPDQRMVAAAHQRGLPLRGKARQIQPLDLETFDLILAMDRQNYQDILALDPAGRSHHKVRLICDFCTDHLNTEVPDPYFGGSEGFHYVFSLLLDACEGLLHYLTQVKTIS